MDILNKINDFRIILEKNRIDIDRVKYIITQDELRELLTHNFLFGYNPEISKSYEEISGEILGVKLEVSDD